MIWDRLHGACGRWDTGEESLKMATIKSQKKRNLTNERRRQRNVTVRSRVKSYIKQAMDAMDAKDVEKVRTALPAALSQIDRAASKGVMHPNNAARKKSILQRRAGTL